MAGDWDLQRSSPTFSLAAFAGFLGFLKVLRAASVRQDLRAAELSPR